MEELFTPLLFLFGVICFWVKKIEYHLKYFHEIKDSNFLGFLSSYFNASLLEKFFAVAPFPIIGSKGNSKIKIRVIVFTVLLWVSLIIFFVICDYQYKSDVQ